MVFLRVLLFCLAAVAALFGLFFVLQSSAASLSGAALAVPYLEIKSLLAFLIFAVFLCSAGVLDGIIRLDEQAKNQADRIINAIRDAPRIEEEYVARRKLDEERKARPRVPDRPPESEPVEQETDPNKRPLWL